MASQEDALRASRIELPAFVTREPVDHLRAERDLLPRELLFVTSFPWSLAVLALQRRVARKQECPAGIMPVPRRQSALEKKTACPIDQELVEAFDDPIRFRSVRR